MNAILSLVAWAEQKWSSEYLKWHGGPFAGNNSNHMLHLLLPLTAEWFTVAPPLDGKSGPSSQQWVVGDANTYQIQPNCHTIPVAAVYTPLGGTKPGLNCVYIAHKGGVTDQCLFTRQPFTRQHDQEAPVSITY